MCQDKFGKTPQPPYYAVIFTSQLAESGNGYVEMAERMLELAAQQPGFLGVESARDSTGFGLTTSYWTSEEAIEQWKAQAEHQAAQTMGKQVWYAHFEVRVAKVQRAYGKEPM